jgi:hypothetical protein
MGINGQVDEPEQLRKPLSCSDIRPGEIPSQWIKRMKKEQKKNGKS